ncbi:MAG: hypothetical protein U5L02_04290 [Rheinheimera sp.]|nr:hypothetical protein [Rheinheimera sp.]
MVGYQQRNDPYFLSVVYLMLAQIAAQQQSAAAGPFLDNALKLAEKHHLNQQLSDGYLLRSQLQQQAGSAAAALSSLQLHLQFYKAYHNEAAAGSSLGFAQSDRQ